MYDEPFMDAVNRATYHEMVPGAHKVEGHRRILAQYRQALRRATRYALDDDAVRLICHMTKQQDKMELWAILARLPFDTLWMEFDLWEKCREFEKMGSLRGKFDKEHVSHRCGLLFQRDLDSETRWVCTEFVETSDGPIPQPVAMVFDPEGSPLRPVTGCVLWNELTLSREWGVKLIPVSVMSPDGKTMELETKADPEFGYLGMYNVDKAVLDADGSLELTKNSDGTYTPSQDFLGGPEGLTDKIGCVAEPIWADKFIRWKKSLHKKGYFRSADFEGAEKRRQIFKAVQQQDAIERTGVLKWYITALAMINDVPVKTKHVQPRSGKMLTKSGPTPYLGYNVITISIPKPMDIRYIGRKLTEAATEAHRKRHEVTGHWRIIEFGKSRLNSVCKHQPTMSEDGLAICTRCERIIRWIRPHERGDSRLGYVDHGYVVKG